MSVGSRKMASPCVVATRETARPGEVLMLEDDAVPSNSSLGNLGDPHQKARRTHRGKTKTRNKR